MAQKRIGYIDAMRGFTMILVVYAHICHFCLADSQLGFNAVFILFRLPCFFMLSGWLFQPVSQRPFAVVARHKVIVQLVPTFIFLLLLAPPPFFFYQLGTFKGGYWFTFVLFEFFILFMLFERVGRQWSVVLALLLTVSSFFYDSYRNQYFVSPRFSISDALGFLSFPLWRFFLFFYVGAWMRHHFDIFIQWTDKPTIFIVITVVFFYVSSTPHSPKPWFEMWRFYIAGITGMWMVFTFFRYFYTQLSKKIIPTFLTHTLSVLLKYIGTRTLDVYLLHYFFLPRFLITYTDQLRVYNSTIIEFLFILSVSICVLSLSLLTSYILRLSPFLAHYLFGVPKETTT